MQETKNKIKSLGFTSGHIQLLTVAFIVIGGLIVFKSGINITTMFASADDNVKPSLTYEEAKAQVVAENGDPLSSTTLTSEEEDQMALLDRGEIDGEVLGEAIGIGAIPDADQMEVPEISSQVKVVVAPTDNEASRLQYLTSTQKTENDAQITTLLGELNSTDHETLVHAVKGWGWVIDTLEKTPVPSSLADYHKKKITYYAVMQNIGMVYSGQKSEDDLPVLTKAMLSFSAKVESLRAQLNETYKINL